MLVLERIGAIRSQLSQFDAHGAMPKSRRPMAESGMLFNKCKLALMFKSYWQMPVVHYHRDFGVGSPTAVGTRVHQCLLKQGAPNKEEIIARGTST